MPSKEDVEMGDGCGGGDMHSWEKRVNIDRAYTYVGAELQAFQ